VALVSNWQNFKPRVLILSFLTNFRFRSLNEI